MGNCKSRTLGDDEPKRSGSPTNNRNLRGYTVCDLTEAQSIVRKEIEKEERKARSAMVASAAREEKSLKASQKTKRSITLEVSQPIKEHQQGLPPLQESSSSSFDSLPVRKPRRAPSPPARSASLTVQADTRKRSEDKRLELAEAEQILRLKEAVERERRRVKAAELRLWEEEQRAEAAAKKELRDEIERVYHREKLKRKHALDEERRRAAEEAAEKILRQEEAKRAAKRAAKALAQEEKAAKERLALEREREKRLLERESKTRKAAQVNSFPPSRSESPPKLTQKAAEEAAPIELVLDRRTGRMVWIPPAT
jgi:hypothetical protein